MKSSAPEFERLDQATLIVLARHHQHIDRAAAGRQQPRLPTQLDTGHVFEFGAGNQRIDARIGFDLRKRGALIFELKHLVIARTKHATDDQPGCTARIDQSDAHASKPLSRYFKALQDAP